MSEFKNLLDVLTAGRELPAGFDTWGIKSTNPDLTTRGGFRWPFPGNIAEAPDFDFGNLEACPAFPGDGLCVARSWVGMASGGFPAVTLLLVAYRSDRARGTEDKVRTDRVAVADLVDGARLVREHGSRADLCWANLSGANLSRASLSGADLSEANLSGADLSRAHLSGANLFGANLRGANLYGAYLYGTYLHGADLPGANLHGAYLPGANLSGANLSGAYLSGANLSGANLSGADLYRVNLHGANLHGADLCRANLYRANLSASQRALARDAGAIL